MPKYLSPKRGQQLTIAICPRCHFKRYHFDLVRDPNTKQLVCRFDCQDLYDPYRLTPLSPDRITVREPRPDDELIISAEAIPSILDFFAHGESGLWYDPSDLLTLFQDSAGTIPVTGPGQPVGLMLDKSGNGNHAVQSVDSKRPILQQDIDGSYYLSFDGIDDYLSISELDIDDTDALGIWVGSAVFDTASQSFIIGTSAGI